VIVRFTKEAKCAAELQLLEKAGEISDLYRRGRSRFSWPGRTARSARHLHSDFDWVVRVKGPTYGSWIVCDLQGHEGRLFISERNGSCRNSWALRLRNYDGQSTEASLDHRVLPAKKVRSAQAWTVVVDLGTTSQPRKRLRSGLAYYGYREEGDIYLVIHYHGSIQ